MNQGYSGDRKGKGNVEGYRLAALGAILTVLLLVCGVLGSRHNSDFQMASMEESRSRSVEESVRESLAESEQASAEESLREETAIHEMELTYMQERFVNLVWEKLEDGDLEGAARVLILNRDQAEELFFDSLADGFFLYDGSRMTDQNGGTGMVFTRASTVFYGEFKNGRPEGECLALQAVELEEGVRYDYSKGTWKQGRMEGVGESGYNYYEGVAGDSAKQAVKTGNFSGDLMEGTITYTSINGRGEAAMWTMDVKDGVIVLDGRWKEETADGGKEVYRLTSNTDAGHVYAVDAAVIGEPRWKNMIGY